MDNELVRCHCEAGETSRGNLVLKQDCETAAIKAAVKCRAQWALGLRFARNDRGNPAPRNDRERGQAILEYFVLFALMAMVTLIGVTTFDKDMSNSLLGWFQTASNHMVNE